MKRVAAACGGSMQATCNGLSKEVRAPAPARRARAPCWPAAALPTSAAALPPWMRRSRVAGPRAAASPHARPAARCCRGLWLCAAPPRAQVLGQCDMFEEKQVGGERFNFFTG